MCLLKLSDLLLTPSSSTQPAHSVLWDALWLILSLHPSPPSLVTYLPFCSSLQVSLSPLLSQTNGCIVLCYVWGNMKKEHEEKKKDWRIKTRKWVMQRKMLAKWMTDSLLHNERMAVGRDKILVLHALLIKARVLECGWGRKIWPMWARIK